MGLLIWLAAIVLIIWGLAALINGSVLFGLIIIVVGCILGSGGYYRRP